MTDFACIARGNIEMSTFLDAEGEPAVLIAFTDSADRDVEIAFSAIDFVNFADHAGALSDAIVSACQPPPR